MQLFRKIRKWFEKKFPLYQPNEYWRYVRRCECCGRKIVYALSREDLSYEEFRQYVMEDLPRTAFESCGHCKGVTVQRLVQFDEEEEEEEGGTKKLQKTGSE